MNVPALEVRIGHKVIGCGEEDFIVDQIDRVDNERVPEHISDQGGWVVLTGDSEDGFYVRHYGARQRFYAAPDELINVE